jgi:hypothetical protein
MHWTAEGWFLAYKLLCEKLGIRPELALLTRPLREVEIVLDLGLKMERPSMNRLDYTISSKIRRRRTAM